MQKIYCERANGHTEFWTYSDGQRVFLKPARAFNLLAEKGFKLVKI